MTTRVLLVDDDPAATHLASRLLRTRGVQTREINAPQDALSQAHTFQPHAVIVDYRMPHMTGADVAWQFAGDPVLKNVPLLICSASAEEISRSLLPGNGISILPKPFNLESVLLWLKGCLGPAAAHSL